MLDFQTMLRRYAELLVGHGANVQPGQIVSISAEACHREFAVLISEEAYRRGAKSVIVELTDARIQRQRILSVQDEFLDYIPPHIPLKFRNLVDEGGATIKLVGPEFPMILADLDPKRISRERKAFYQSLRYFYDEGIDRSRVHWSMGAAATPAWGKRIFPQLDPQAAEAALWSALFKIVRVDQDNFLEIWEEHDKILQVRARTLTELQIDTLHYTGPGTDLTVGLSPRAIFRGGSDESPRGVAFEPNIPTEECYSAPDARRTSGTVRATRPVLVNGVLVEGLSMTFVDGEITEFSASQGESAFREYISIDAGAKRVGEVALVGIDSPVYQSGLVFEEILLDENAACHIAIGSAYKNCIENGVTLSKEELGALGCNDSLAHLDIMISSEQVDVMAKTWSGEEVPLIRRGEWMPRFLIQK